MPYRGWTDEKCGSARSPAHAWRKRKSRPSIRSSRFIDATEARVLRFRGSVDQEEDPAGQLPARLRAEWRRGCLITDERTKNLVQPSHPRTRGASGKVVRPSVRPDSSMRRKRGFFDFEDQLIKKKTPPGNSLPYSARSGYADASLRMNGRKTWFRQFTRAREAQAEKSSIHPFVQIRRCGGRGFLDVEDEFTRKNPSGGVDPRRLPAKRPRYMYGHDRAERTRSFSTDLNRAGQSSCAAGGG
jgi:hypothetical protein